MARSSLLWQDVAEWFGSAFGLEERQLLGGLAVKQNADIINTHKETEHKCKQYNSFNTGAFSTFMWL